MKLSVIRRFFHVILLLTAVAGFGLAGCSEFKQAEEGVKSASDEADRALQAITPKSPIAQPLMIDKRPYYGSQAIPIKNGENLPSQFESSGSIVMTFARPVTLPELARMVQAVTGIRAAAPSIATGSAAAEEGESSSSSSAGGTTFIPSDGEQVSGGRVVWQGKLSELLNQASDVFGAEWIYDGTTIQFAQQVTRTFMLHALATELSVKGTVKSGSSGDSTSNLPEVDVTSTTSMKVWEEIKSAVDTITNGNGTAAYSPSTGTITVTGSPVIVRRVESYLNQQNALRLRRVAVAIKVLSVTTRDALTLTSNLTGVIERAFDTAAIRSIGNVTTGLAIGVLKAPEVVPADGIAADDSLTRSIEEDRLSQELQALKVVERVSISHSGAIVTLSDQPAPLQVGRQTTYLARVSSTTGDSGGSSSLEPGTINTGLLMTVLPRIVEQNKILMRLSVAITELQSLETATSGETSIQTPEVSTTGFLQNAVLTSGETMILAGFEKDDNSSNENGTPGVSWALGGTKESNKAREVSIMMITAEILPEDPITVVGQ